LGWAAIEGDEQGGGERKKEKRSGRNDGLVEERNLGQRHKGNLFCVIS